MTTTDAAIRCQPVIAGEEATIPSATCPEVNLDRAVIDVRRGVLLKYSKAALADYLAISGIPIESDCLRSLERCEQLRVAGQRLRTLDRRRSALLAELESCKSVRKANEVVRKCNRIRKEIDAATKIYDRRVAAMGKDTTK